MVIGLTVLGLLYFKQLNLDNGSGGVDFERVLPGAINGFFPVGILGIVLTGLLGAFMGTFSGTLNAAQAYIVNDIYLKVYQPKCIQQKNNGCKLYFGYCCSCCWCNTWIFYERCKCILQWIVSGLYGGYIAANVLKWYWWRFNANGFFWGMFAGTAGALIFSEIFSGMQFLYFFPVLFLISLAGCLIGTYTAPATETATLKKF